MYGGMCTSGYFQSALNTKEVLNNCKFHHDFLITTNESLIQRARNTSVATFLKTDFERLLFIDADIEFSVNDIESLWNLDVDVAVAAYSMKRPDKPLSAWEDGKLVEIEGRTEPFEVDYAGTGFMMIKRKVFEDLQKAHPELDHEEGKVGRCHAWFDCPIWNDTQMSEDYNFCRKFRDLGGKITLDPTIRLGHWGSFRYG
jgi:choline kinase